MALETYRRKRDFSKTAEPSGGAQRAIGHWQFVVQKHAARQMHYDFRLELDGVLLSWAVPKGPSLDPAVKSLAIQVEDHPLEYATFEGIIPQGEYGGGTVMVWDRGIWQPEGDPRAGYRRGNLKFRLAGEKLRGRWALVRMRGEEGQNWLLMKKRDGDAVPGDKYRLTRRQPDSVLTGRTLDEIAADADRRWDVSRPAGQARRPGPGHGKQQAKPSATRPDIQALVKTLKGLAGAVAATLPDDLVPQLATLTAEAPSGDDWLHELKFDGYRLLAWIDGDRVRLVTRRGLDWTDRFAATAEAIAQLNLPGSILDGELVALDEHGVPHFQKLQNSLRQGRNGHLVYYVFDAPFLLGHDLRQTPLLNRKQVLAKLLLAHDPGNAGAVRYSDHVTGQGAAFRSQACEHGLEGVVSKRATAPYRQGRSSDWRKLKCQGRQEFVIAGYTQPQGSRTDFGSLLLGYCNGPRLVYCGRVGTGFTQQSLRQLGHRLKTLRRDECPFEPPPPRAAARGATWVEPVLVAEVAFGGWTSDGVLRHASFQGLREDKEAPEVVLERPVNSSSNGHPSPTKRESQRGRGAASKAAKKTGGGDGRASSPQGKRRPAKPQEVTVAGVRLTNPDRVLYPTVGITKADLAQFYESIADWVLPYVVDRPLTLVRCPEGADQACFYQKHWTPSLPEAVKHVEVREKKGSGLYVLIDDLPGLISLVQMGVLEMHPWSARADRLERPEMVVFDLDPGEGVPWQQVKQAARDVRTVLEELGLKSFLRTTGGKGLHVVVPIDRRTSWDDTSRFAQQVAQGLVRAAPKQYVATMRKQLRSGKVFIDYFRNTRGATSIASYSTRSRPRAPVATPLNWDELEALESSGQYHVGNLRQRLQQFGDPWETFHGTRQSLTKAVRQKAESLVR